MSDINSKFSNILMETEYVEQHNFIVSKVDPELTIHHTDSLHEIRKKKKLAKKHIRHYGYFLPLYPHIMKTGTPPEETPTEPDVHDGSAATPSEMAFTYPDSIGPTQDDEFLNTEAMSSTERMRRYNRRNPEKVRAYLRKTQKDRVTRNRDRKKAIKRHGKKKMKNHDVHHPNGTRGGKWVLARKDHGRDKVNDSIEYVYMHELTEGTVPNGPWQLIVEGRTTNHLAHPYADDTLTFGNIKEMVKRALVGELNADVPLKETLVGQNILFSVKEGAVVFARSKSHLKHEGKNAIPASDLRQMFAGKADEERAFTQSAHDLQATVNSMSPEKIESIFANGRKFMSVEIIFPTEENLTPYGKSVLLFHGTMNYDANGNEIARNINDGKVFDQQLQVVSAKRQKKFGLSGPQPITFNDADISRNIKKLHEYGAEISRIQAEYELDDTSTIEDYKKSWWLRELNNMGISWTPEETEGLISRWALGERKFAIKHIEDLEKKKVIREFEGKHLPNIQKMTNRPLEQIFLRLGSDALLRVVNTLTANNPQIAYNLKQEVLNSIRQLRETTHDNQLAVLQQQIERLEEFGLEKIVPSEGIVFMYNGKPHKFTGAFAPINQILGLLKFNRGKAKINEPEEHGDQELKEISDDEKETEIEPVEQQAPKTIAVFGGKFQPFHPGHYSIYRALVKKFGDENVYIATNDEIDSITSPFSFADKKKIITQMFDIPNEVVVNVKHIYAPKEILSKLPPNTIYVATISETDLAKLTSKTDYFKDYDTTSKENRKPYTEEGYYIKTPQVQLHLKGKNISGAQIRSIMGNPNNTDRAKQEIFTMVYGKFNPDVFNKVVKVSTDAEESSQVTDRYTKDKASAKLKDKELPQRPNQQKQKAEPKKSTARHYEPGQVWRVPGSDMWGAKNQKGEIRYFTPDHQERAKEYATKR